jgi:hypothetical protein
VQELTVDVAVPDEDADILPEVDKVARCAKRDVRRLAAVVQGLIELDLYPGASAPPRPVG